MHLWDLQAGKLEREYTGIKQTNLVLRCNFGGKNSNLIVSGSEDCKIYIWDRASGKLVQTLEGHTNNVNAAVFSPNSTRLVSVSGMLHILYNNIDDHTVRVWTL